MISERILYLASLLSFDLSENTASYAELKGWISSLELVFGDLEVLEAQLYPDSADGLSLDLLSNQFSVSGSLGEVERRQLVADRLKLIYGSYENGALKEKIKEYGLSSTVTPEIFTLYTTSELTVMTSGLLDDFSSVLKNYLSPMTYVFISGDGYDFNLWDSTDYTFDGYDRLDLPFYILDELK